MRYADSDGYHDDTTRSMWRYRDYVIESFNKNKPFDQFTIEQLAGDLLPNATVEQKIGTAFHRNGPTSSEGGADAKEYAARYAVDRVNTTARTWLGITMECAECHDHKYDPFKTREYYQMFAFFDQVPENPLLRDLQAPPTMGAPTREQEQQIEKAVKSLLIGHSPQGNWRKDLKQSRLDYRARFRRAKPRQPTKVPRINKEVGSGTDDTTNAASENPDAESEPWFDAMRMCTNCVVVAVKLNDCIA